MIAESTPGPETPANAVQTERVSAEATVPDDLAGSRVDQAAAMLFDGHSRSRLGEWLRNGSLTVDGRRCKPSERVFGGEWLRLDAQVGSAVNAAAEAVALDVCYQDAACLVVNKPPGLTVHPGAGQPAGTLVNALLHREPGLAALPRAGLVHRLDKDTSGLLVVARTLTAHTVLTAALQRRDIHRQYLALVQGQVIAGASIDAPIGRHPRDRLRKAIDPEGRPAVSHYRVRERLARHSLLEVTLETGRTHQIRVHLAHVGFPIVGDPLYGGGLKLPRGASEPVREALRAFRRQALHAGRLGFVSPDSGEQVLVEAPMPADMAGLLDWLRTI